PAAYMAGVLCFFFQAEDGIRDFHVTGVQTCALPISVATVLSIMLKKGLAKRSRGPNGWIWSANVSRGATARQMVDKILNHVFAEIGRASCRDRVELLVVGVRVVKMSRSLQHCECVL